jgi:hypothetical protein
MDCTSLSRSVEWGNHLGRALRDHSLRDMDPASIPRMLLEVGSRAEGGIVCPGALHLDPGREQARLMPENEMAAACRPLNTQCATENQMPPGPPLPLQVTHYEEGGHCPTA